MNLSCVNDFVKKGVKYLNDNSPAVLTGIGIAGVICAVVKAVEKTPEAMDAVVEKAENELHTDGLDFVDAKEALGTPKTIATGIKYYIPSIALGGMSIACFIGAQSINAKRNAALATLYAVTSNEFNTYKDEVVKKLGEKKEHEIVDRISEKKINEDPLSNSEVVVDNGDTLCYDTWSGRYFKSSITKIERAVNEINSECIEDLYASLNDFYFLLGLPDIKCGDNCGWNTDHKLNVYFSAQVADNDSPCIVLNYNTEPIATYTQF